MYYIGKSKQESFCINKLPNVVKFRLKKIADKKITNFSFADIKKFSICPLINT